MTIVTRRFATWNDQMQRRLRRATLPGGYLIKFMKARPNSWTIVLFSPSGQIIGWCGILEFHHRCYANMFINQRYRRQGYATTLIRHTLKKFIPVHVAVWDGTTTKLCRKLTQQFPGCIVPYQWTETKNRFDRLTRLKS